MWYDKFVIMTYFDFKISTYILIFYLFVFSFSCRKKKTETSLDVGYDYAPTLLGKYVVYDVDSTVYDDFNDDTVYYKYRIKEKLEERLPFYNQSKVKLTTENLHRNGFKIIDDFLNTHK